jgi:hypothetical protein
MLMKKKLLASVLALMFVFPSFALAQTTTKANSPARRAAESITAAQMKDYLYFIASDEMEGRDTPSRGLDLTAKFIAMNLSRWGIKPAGNDGTYFQKFALRRDKADREKSWIEINGQKFAYGEDFINVSGTKTGEISAPIVFVGNGWMIKSKNLNPYEGIDVKGKIVAVYGEGVPTSQDLVPMPPGITYTDLEGQLLGVNWSGPSSYARRNGAVGILALPSKFTRENWGQVRQGLDRNRLSVEKFAQSSSSAPVAPSFLASEKLANALFSGESHNPLNGTAGKSFDLSPNKKININLALKQETSLMTQNVVAILEGSDPVLKNEYVAIGAHYDHDGMNPNIQGPDKIFNGADDDGSGTTGVLAIAEALAKSPKRPKRSILFVWHAGEEKGLWGSEYFTKYPTVPLDKVVTHLNIDMIGRSRKAGDTNSKNKELTGENEIYVIGPKIMSTQLENVTDSVNKSFLNLSYNSKYDDPKEPNQFFFRSDHYHYATKGIPIVFWFNGVHEDYHQPGDSPDKIDYQKMEKITRTIFLTLWELADAKKRPQIDKKLPSN